MGIRDEFEAYAATMGWESRHMKLRPDGGYSDWGVQPLWLAWQASRAALVIELPQIVAFEACYDSLRENEYAGLPDQFSDFDADEVLALHRSDEVRAAIEAAGVKVAQ